MDYQVQVRVSNFIGECRILDFRPRIGLTLSLLALAYPVPEEESVSTVREFREELAEFT